MPATAYTPTTTQPITNYIPVLLTAASGVARFDHNPTTGESLGLLVEEQRTNLVTYSEEFDNAAWDKNEATITENAAVAPNGANTADLLLPTAVNVASHFIRPSSLLTVTAGTVWTISCYAKAYGYDKLRLSCSGTTDWTGGVQPLCNFNLSNQTTYGQSAGVVSTSITSVGNGWFRCSITTTAALSASFSSRIAIWVMNPNGTSNAYTGDGYSGIFIWGAQLEAGAFPTSYIPTVAATVTRNADAASMTGANFTSWFNNAEGTLYGDVQAANAAQVFYYVVASSGTGNEIRLATQSNGGNPNFAVTVNFVSQASISRTFAAGLRHKIAGSYRTNNFEAAVNGTSGTSDTDGILPTPDRLDIGQRSNGGNVINGTIRKIAYYPSRLPDAQLQALTS
jgi:hypothetical protein